MENKEYIEYANEWSGFNKHNGIRIVEMGEDYCIVEGALRKETMNPWDMAHGGFVYALCDVAAGALISSKDCKGVTLSSSMHFMRQSKGTKLRAEGRIIKRGKTVSVIESAVYDDTGCMTAKGTFEIFALH